MDRVYCDTLGERAERVLLSAGETHHLVHVRRARPGSTVILFDGRGVEAEGRLAAVEDGRAQVELIAVRRAPADTRVLVTVVTAIPKGSRMAELVRACTEIGACEIRPVISARSSRRPPLGSASERWARIAREAAKQSRRAVVPAVAPVASFDAAIEDAGSFDLRLLAEAGEEATPLRDVLAPGAAGSRIMLAVGPEGGFAEDERKRAAAQGFRIVRADGPVMRVETAAQALLAIVIYACS